MSGVRAWRIAALALALLAARPAKATELRVFAKVRGAGTALATRPLS